MAHHEHQQQEQHPIAVQARGNAAGISIVLGEASSKSAPGILLQAVVVSGDKTSEGQIIEAVAIPWFKINEMIQRDPRTIYEIDWRKWEEIIAGAYKQQGFDVMLTPRSNDGGVDVIATLPGFGSIRYFDQVKAYAAGRVVTANDVSALLGALDRFGNVSKGIVTTTSEFAPGIATDPTFQRFMPYRLELRAKDALLEWLRAAAEGKADRTI
jgi:restriction system protein